MTEQAEPRRRRSYQVKVAKEYEAGGERRTKFAPVGWLTAVDDGKIAYYLDLDLLSNTRFVVFRNETQVTE